MQHIDGIALPTSTEELLDPATTALIVYDVQIGIVSQIEGGPQIVEQCGRVLQAARTAGVRTVFTRHLSLPRELMGMMQYRTAMAWQHAEDPMQVTPWFLRDSPGFAIVSELEPRPSEAVFDKITMSAFEGTPLAITLRDCGIRSVVLCGIALEIGIEPTARHAADLGFVPVIVRDASGYGNAEAAERTIAALTFLGDALMSNVSEITRVWSSVSRVKHAPST